jgi:hypothetical protein
MNASGGGGYMKEKDALASENSAKQMGEQEQRRARQKFQLEL